MDVCWGAEMVTYLLWCCSVCYLCAACPQSVPGARTPPVCVWLVSALQLVWDALQQMCMVGPTHLGTYLFCWGP